jgi:type I restriction enzyme R subunit
MTTPEARARAEIDTLLAAAGWQVQNRNQLNLSAARGVAVREFPLKTGYAVAEDLGVESDLDDVVVN